MLSSIASTSKRPDLKKEGSSSRWDMQKSVSTNKEGDSVSTSPIPPTSLTPQSRDHDIQESEDRPLSPVLSIAGSARTARQSDAAGRSEDMSATGNHDSKTTADSDAAWINLAKFQGTLT